MKLHKDPRFWYGLVFVVFILFRLFFAPSAYFIGGDEAKFLKGALDFPNYAQWNNQLDLYNPPVLSYLFAIGGWALGDPLRGAQIIELIFAIVLFAYSVKLFRLLGKSDAWIWIAMLFLSLAHEMIMMAYRLYKEGVYVAFFVMMLYYFLRAVRGEHKHYLTTAVIGAVTAYTTDHLLLMFPILFLMLFVFKTNKTSFTKAMICLAVVGIVFTSWLGVKVWVYETNDWYPAGADGTPEYVRDYGLREVLSPSGFPNTAIMIGNEIELRFAHMASYLAYLMNLEPALMNPDLTYETARQLLSVKPLLFMLLIYLPLSAIILIGVWASRRFFFTTKPSVRFLQNNQAFFMAVMYVILNVFIVYKGFSNRYSLGAAIPLAFFLVEGIAALAKKAQLKLTTVAQVLLGITLVAVVPMHLMTHTSFFLTMPFEVDGQRTAMFLKSLPEDGIMAQAGYTPELMWLTHPKRVLSLPRTPEHFEGLLDKYDIQYAVFGERYWAPPLPENKDKVWDYDTINHIRNHPERFMLIKTITEEYETMPDDRLSVYRVIEPQKT